MKKVIIILVIFFVFLFGISLGGAFSNTDSKLFEESLDEFEKEITKRNNNYESKTLVPEENKVNLVAHKIDKFMDDKIRSIIRKIVD